MVESRTKVKLSSPDIKGLVRHGLGDVGVLSVRELVDGYFNTAYHLELDAEPGHVVLKVGPPGDADILSYEQGLMRAEIEAMKLVATNPAVPVPAVLFDDLSRTHLPFHYFFMEFVEGTSWGKLRDGLTDQQNDHIEAELGRITAAINGIERGTFGYFAYGPEFERWRDAFRWMCELLYADARRYGISAELVEEEFLDHFEQHRDIFDEVTRPQLVHWDLWAGNVFVAFDGEVPMVTGVMDFERALWGDSLMEFIPGRLGDIDSYIDGYGEDVLATRSQRLRRIFYNVYLALVLIIEDGPRQYEDKHTVEWGRGLLERNAAMLRHGGVIEGLTAFA